MKNWIAFVMCALLLGCLIPAAPLASAAEPFYVTGQVTDDDGIPISQVNVSASNVTSGLTFFSISNDAGVYNISVPGGVYNISASRINYLGNVTYQDIIVGPNNVVGFNFTLSEVLGRVFGYVTSGNVSVGSVTITLSNAQRSFVSQSQLPFGQYSIDNVIPGVYLAKAEKSDYWTAYAEAPVVVTRGNSEQVNFSLEVQPARVFGTVSVGGTPEAEVTVELLLGGAVKREAQTDSGGNYSFANLPSGEYELRLSREGLVAKTIDVSLEAFEEKRVDPSMSRAPVEGLKGFIGDLDLTHSLMVVAMLVAVIVMAFAIFVRMRSIKNPDMLADEEEEEVEREEKTKKK